MFNYIWGCFNPVKLILITINFLEHIGNRFTKLLHQLYNFISTTHMINMTMRNQYTFKVAILFLDKCRNITQEFWLIDLASIDQIALFSNANCKCIRTTQHSRICIHSWYKVYGTNIIQLYVFLTTKL